MKVEAFVTYRATLDVGDIPCGKIETLLAENDGGGDFNIFEQGDEVTVTAVELSEVK